MAHTASSPVGLARFAFGGIAAPLIGLGGGDDALSLGIVTVVSMTVAVGTYAKPLCGRDHARQGTVVTAADDARVRDGGALSALADGSRPAEPLWPMLGAMDRRRAVRQFVATCR